MAKIKVAWDLDKLWKYATRLEHTKTSLLTYESHMAVLVGQNNVQLTHRTKDALERLQHEHINRNLPNHCSGILCLASSDVSKSTP